MQQRRKILFVLALFGVLLLALFVYFFASRTGKTAVSITAVGKSVKIKIDNRPAGSGTAYLKPGLHTFAAEAVGFKKIEKKLEVGNQPTQATLILTPESDEAKKWAAEHQKDYLEAEKLAGEQTRAEGEAFTSSNPITRYLPEKTSYYSIDYRVNEKNQAIIIISSSSALGRQVALEKIRSFGFDPTDFVITFNNFIPAFNPVILPKGTN